MKPHLTFNAVSGSLGSEQMRGLVVSGAWRAAQERALQNASIVISRGEDLVAAAVYRPAGADLRIEEVGIKDAEEDLPDQLIDMLETIALAGGYTRLVVSSSSGSVRRALRLLGYTPQMEGRRLCFVWRF